MNGNRRGRVLNRRVPDHLLAQRQVPIIPRVSLGLALPCQTLRAPLCRREAVLESFRLFLGRRITRRFRAPLSRRPLAPRRRRHDDSLQR